MNYLTVNDVISAHAEHGRLNWHMVKKAMGPNWPIMWDRMGAPVKESLSLTNNVSIIRQDI